MTARVESLHTARGVGDKGSRYDTGFRGGHRAADADGVFGHRLGEFCDTRFGSVETGESFSLVRRSDCGHCAIVSADVLSVGR